MGDRSERLAKEERRKSLEYVGLHENGRRRRHVYFDAFMYRAAEAGAIHFVRCRCGECHYLASGERFRAAPPV